MSEKKGLPPDHAAAVEELLAIMHEHDLDAIKIDIGDASYELVRREAQAVQGVAAPHVSAAPAESPRVVSAEPAAPANVKRITAPLIGVFYRAAAPGAEPFVNPGDRVEIGQPVCILEAMKLMNEITSDYAGVIARIVPENGELVTIGQELFWIEP